MKFIAVQLNFLVSVSLFWFLPSPWYLLGSVYIWQGAFAALMWEELNGDVEDQKRR